MPRLLLLCEYASLNGGERSMLATLGGVVGAGFSVSVAAPEEGPLAEMLAAAGVEVLPFSVFDRAGSRMSQGQARELIGELIRRHRPQLVHANSLSMGRMVGPVAAELDVPCIAHLRDIIKLSAKAVDDLNQNTRLIAVSGATRDFHVAGGLADDKTRVLYNGVDLDRFHPRPATGYLHRELGLPADARLVGAIGQIGLRKGLDVLAAAAVLLKDKLPEVHYLIVGRRWSDKEESRRFEDDLRAVAAGELSGRMHFLGVRNDVDRLLGELTLLAHAARQEPLGRVLLESAASGIAVVATDVGGTREIFPPEFDAASLIPPDDAESLAAAISRLLGDEERRVKQSVAAWCRVKQAFSAERAAASLVTQYHQTIESR